MDEPGHIYSVSTLTASLKAHVEGAFPYVWVRGQVGNVSRPSSGHLYFTLRDADCSLAAVWFKGRQRPGEAFDPLTGEVYEDGPRPCLAHSLEDGQEIVCAGPLQIYGARGQYQLVVELAQDAGLGLLHERFARLCRSLEERGFFSLDRKRPLPAAPERIAMITAPSGAAIHDFMRIAQGRGFGSHIRIFPVPVQGEAAPAKILEALDRIVTEGWAELVVLIRGGGSLEDLWAFNDEKLAGAIYAYPLPVLAGIGHEIDFTLADMTADVRAATPSHAAQLLWPERQDIYKRLATAGEALEKEARLTVARRDQDLAGMERALQWRSPGHRLSGLYQRLASSRKILDAAARLGFEKRRYLLQTTETALASVPSSLPVRFERLHAVEARLEPSMERSVSISSSRFFRLTERLESAGSARIAQAVHALEMTELRLHGADPHAPLEKGYALVRKPDATYVTKIGDAVQGDSLRLVLRDGELPVRVEGEK